jgi:hypothetical protein
MGAGASLPEHLDIETVQALAGGQFDETKFNSIAVQGKITKTQFEELAAAISDAPGTEELGPKEPGQVSKEDSTSDVPVAAIICPAKPPQADSSVASVLPVTADASVAADMPVTADASMAADMPVTADASMAADMPVTADASVAAEAAVASVATGFTPKEEQLKIVASRPAVVAPAGIVAGVLLPNEQALKVQEEQTPIASRGLFVVGALIEAKFGGGTQWYPGKVSQINSDRTYVINYSDGDSEGSVAEEMIRPLAAQAAVDTANERLAVGCTVTAQFEGKPMWFSGKITEVHDDGTYAIAYDDGDAEQKVPRTCIRTAEEQSDVCPLALHPVLKKMSFPQRLKLSGCTIQTSCNGIYLLSYSTYQGHPMYKKYNQEQYLYHVLSDSTWNISDALGSANVCAYAKQDVFDVCELSKPWKELKEGGGWAKNKDAKWNPHS